MRVVIGSVTIRDGWRRECTDRNGYRAGGGGMGIGPAFTPPDRQAAAHRHRLASISHLVQFVVPAIYVQFGAVTARTKCGSRAILWQPFTYMWLHDRQGIGHILMNCFVLWMFGSPLAMAWGPKRLMRFYLVCGVGAGLVIIATWPYHRSTRMGLGIAAPTTLARRHDGRRIGRDLRRHPRLLAHLARPHHHVDLPAGGVPGDLADSRRCSS